MTVYFGTNTTEPTALLQLDSTTEGVLVPRMTTTQRDAISSPAESLLIFNITTNRFNWYDADNTTWRELSASGLSSTITADQLFLDDNSELTIATGAITVTKAKHTVDTESDAASDDLDTISGTTAGETFILFPNNTARTVVVKNGTDNIITSTGSDITLDETYKGVLCLSDGTNVIACPLFSSTSGGGSSELTLNAGGGYPSTTNGCAAPTRVEFVTNDVDLYMMDFDQTTIEYAQFTTTMPDNWDASTVTFRAYWTAASGTAAQTVEWNLQGLALGNDDAIDATWGSSIEVSDALIATGDLHVTSTSSAVTIGGTPAAGDLVVFRVWRDASNDTLAADARLIAIKIDYGTV